MRPEPSPEEACGVRYPRALPVAPAGIDAPPHELGSSRPSRAALLAATIAIVSIALIVAEAISGWHDLHSTEFFTSLAAKKYVWANAAVALLTTLIALFAPGRLRWLAVIGPGIFLGGVLLVTATAGGAALAMVMALLTMAAFWDTGERLLRRIGADGLAANVLVAWLAGIGPWALATMFLGRIYLLKWWTIGLVLIVVGAIGLFRLARLLFARRSAILGEVGSSPAGLASLGLMMLTAGWAAIYTAAPELQYDALYGKAALPEAWARSGHLGSLANHVQFEIAGWFQVLATLGHLFGATAIGRYLQLVGLFCAAAAVWWWGRRHGLLGPFAALAVLVTPQIFWQTSTADDDLLLALCALAFAIAIVETVRRREASARVAFALGLLAGCGPSLKLHLVPLFALLILGWLWVTRAQPGFARRLGATVGGALITGLPPFVLRWIDSGNPVLPAYNNIFRSPDWLPVNENLNLPYWVHPGSFGPFKAVWDAVVEPDKMAEASPPGAYALLVGVIVIAVLLGWLGRDRTRASRIVWFALIPALIFWWTTLRYLRYLLPISFVSVALLIMLTAGFSFGARTRNLGIAGMTALVIACFPVTISEFWNVPDHKPPVYAAIGKWSSSSYEDAALPERGALLAFNRLSPRNAHVATSAYERSYLTGGRDLYNLHYEPLPLMELHGPPPTNGNEAIVDLKRIGIGWLLVSENDRLQEQPGYLSQVITLHGKDEYSARGWDLYRLVAHPPAPRPASACDTRATGVPSCWGGPRGSHGELGVSVTRTLPACPGQTIVLTISQPAGEAPIPALIHFNVTSAEGVQPGTTFPGSTQRIYATAPPGASVVQVVIGSPSPGSVVSHATIGRLGAECAR